jgi:transketolase
LLESINGTKELEKVANKIRIECLKSIYEAKSGHPGGSFSSAEIMSVLFFNQMRIHEDEPLWPLRDRFVLSKGHVAPVLYTTLALRGFFPVEELKTLRKLNSRLLGHPAYKKLPGVDMTSGSLGQGLSIGLGMRLAAELKGEDFKVFVLLGDGEVQEGQIWEAAMAASHFKIKNLIAILDYNRVQLDGTVSEIMEVAPIDEKWASFGWKVVHADGHNVKDLLRALDEANEIAKSGPVVIIANTVKGKGVSFMENNAAWHGASPNELQMKQAVEELTKDGELI